MDVVKKFRNSEYFIPVMAMIISVICGLFFYNHFSIEYYINDDTAMRNIASGSYTGEPDGHLIFIQYVLGFVISVLYKAMPIIDWYGLILFSLHFICLMFILNRVLKEVKGKNRIFLWFAAGIAFFMIDIPHIVSNFQFTTTAAVCGATALFLFISMPKGLSGRKYILACLPIGFLAVMSFCVRDKVLFMMIPMAVIVWAYRIIQEKDINGAVRRYILFCVSVGVAVLAIMAVERIAYSSPEWKEYEEFNSARSKILDYYGYPEYEEHSEIYEDLNISREEYELLTHYALRFSSDFTFEQYIQLADYAQEVYEEENPLSERFGEIIKNTVNYSLNVMYSGKLAIVLVLYLFIAIVGLLRGKYKMLLLLTAIFICREAIYFYLILMNRFPNRIHDSLILCDFAIIAGYMLRCGILCDLKLPKNKVTSLVSGLILCILGMSTYLPYYGYRNSTEEDTDEIVNEYCTENELGGRYVLDSNGFVVGRDEFTIIRENTYINYLTMYGWTCNSALYLEKAERMGMLSIDKALLEDDVYLIETADAVAVDMAAIIIDYYESIGIEVGYRVVDKIPVSLGDYRVLKFYQLEDNL